VILAYDSFWQGKQPENNGRGRQNKTIQVSLGFPFSPA
jgi:hypothetical protein